MLVTEPRRIAARLAATRVADERGVRLGDEVGYRVRFDEKAKPSSRLVYVTEGLLLRRLLDDPTLRGVSAVVFDEVHEQSAELELALALLTRHVESAPGLRLVAMSATLDADRLVDFWGGAPRVTSEGRAYEVRVEHAEKQDDRPLEIQVRSAVRAELERPGDMLVFLPGAREIRRAEEALGVLSELDVVPLHGDLPIEAQAQVVRGSSSRRRVVLATNIAESSLTIPGVTTVIDSGLARVARHDAWSGLVRLEVEPISRARAVQRAGRAGRVAPGVARRLFTALDFNARPNQELPELLRTDLSHLLLLLRASGRKEGELRWLSDAPVQLFDSARLLLEDLGALSGDAITDAGRRMLTFPLPTRLARVLVEAERLGIGDQGALAVSLLAERDIVLSDRRFDSRGRAAAVDSDLEERIERFEEAATSNFNGSTLRALDLDGTRTRAVDQSWKQLKRLLSPGANTPPSSSKDDPARALNRALLQGHADRVAERRGDSNELVLSSGGAARLADTSGVYRAPLLLALSADSSGGRQRDAFVRLAAAIDADLLFDAVGHRIEPVESLLWSPEKERVEQESVLVFGSLTLDRSRRVASPSSESAVLLAKAARTKGAVHFDPESKLETLAVRLTTMSEKMPEIFATLGDAGEELLEALRSGEFAALALDRAAATVISLAELRELDLAATWLDALPSEFRRALDDATPLFVTLPGGLRVPVHYESARPPWIEARLQNFFSVKTTPTLCRGRLPLQVHLLAPNHRAVQVTSDLEGFWSRHYPALRKELMRRYPKHLWPEDGSTAAPPTPGKIR